MTEGVDKSNVLLDEERRRASHHEVKASVAEDVNDRIKRQSARVEPEEAAEVAEVAQELKQKSVHEAVETEREVGRGRTAARVSQVVDYVFYLIDGLIALKFLLALMGARPGNGFVQFINAVTRPLLAPFERIVGTPAVGAHQFSLSYLFALVVYPLASSCNQRRVSPNRAPQGDNLAVKGSLCVDFSAKEPHWKLVVSLL